MIKSLKERLRDILINGRLITPEQLNEAIGVQKKKGGHLASILVNLGYIGEKDLLLTLSRELNIPPADLSKLEISPEIIKLIPKHMAEHYGIVPISRIGKTLTVAMSDPLNVFAMDDVKVLTGFSIRPVVSTEKSIVQAVERYYAAPASVTIEDIIEETKKSKMEIVIEETKEEGGIDSGDLLRLAQETPVIKVTNVLLAEAIKRKASDLLVEPLENELRIRYRVDGILQEAKAPPKSMQNAIISRLKVMSELDIAERRLPQDGRFKIKIGNRMVDFRVSIVPASFGEKAALRVLDKSALMLEMDKLGFEQVNLEKIKECSSRPHGMILVCGPTGCGKTTTLYSILNFVDRPEKNIITVEDPVEYQLKGINQVTYREDIGLTFARALRSILRQDPDIIMVGEIRDSETADIAIKSALTGHLVLSTLHTTDASGSIVRLINMGVEPFLISSSVIMVVAQRLVRILCPNCKEFYEPGQQLKKDLRLAGDKKWIFYRPKGCKACGDTGYRGRTGIIEVLVLTPAIKELVMKRASEAEMKIAARKAGMNTLRENGLQKVKNGITSLKEIMRVTAADRDLL
ncbi:MAG: ATPase, T2SS/T4P/T4SS family [Candidatus Omnitrophota bacterium]|nr:ATPase, T2SS/T4P/T4SS family [Candidatus Omnitrophota bacterium]